MGNMTTNLYEEEIVEENLIRGNGYQYNQRFGFYERNEEDSLYMGIATVKQTLFESLWAFDSTVAVCNTFDPNTRILENKSYALNKDFGVSHETSNSVKATIILWVLRFVNQVS